MKAVSSSQVEGGVYARMFLMGADGLSLEGRERCTGNPPSAVFAHRAHLVHLKVSQMYSLV